MFDRVIKGNPVSSLKTRKCPKNYEKQIEDLNTKLTVIKNLKQSLNSFMEIIGNLSYNEDDYRSDFLFSFYGQLNFSEIAISKKIDNLIEKLEDEINTEGV